MHSLEMANIVIVEFPFIPHVRKRIIFDAGSGEMRNHLLSRELVQTEIESSASSDAETLEEGDGTGTHLQLGIGDIGDLLLANVLGFEINALLIALWDDVAAE